MQKISTMCGIGKKNCKKSQLTIGVDLWRSVVVLLRVR
jgi:hypothetical protein